MAEVKVCFDAKINMRKNTKAVWNPAPREKPPTGKIYCKAIMQYVKHCGAREHCQVRGCKARREGR